MTYATTNRNRKIKNWRNTRRDFQFSENRHFSLIEKRFWQYPKIKEKVREAEDEISYYQSGHKEGGGSSNHAFISDPTSRLGIKKAEGVKVIELAEETVTDPQKWLEMVDKTFEYFKDEQIVTEVLKRRYLRNESMVRTCIELDIRPEQYKQYYKARNAGIRYARDCAIQLGLIKVF